MTPLIQVNIFVLLKKGHKKVADTFEVITDLYLI